MRNVNAPPMCMLRVAAPTRRLFPLPPLQVHDSLDFGKCHLALGVPMTGRFAHVENIEQLKAMGWSEEAPLRVVTGEGRQGLW